MSWLRTFVHSLTRPLLLGVAILLVVCGGTGLHAYSAKAAAGVAQQINYQGRLLDASGLPVADGAYSMILSLYTVSSGGVPAWTAKGLVGSPTALSVTVTDGLFTVRLGDTSVAGGSQTAFGLLDWNQDTWYLGVTVSPDVTEMTPRKQLSAVPQAFNSEQLQGMYALGTAVSGSALFIVDQTGATEATSARTALEVRSSGLSNANDFLIRGINSSSTVAFSVSRTGAVTSTDMNVTGQFRTVFGANTLRFVATTNLGASSIAGIAIHGRYAYINLGDTTFKIVDVSDMVGGGIIGSVASIGGTDIVIRGNYAYTIGGSSLFVIDISDPAAPVLKTTFSTLPFDAASIKIQGNKAFVGGFAGFTVIDISNPLSLRTVGSKTISVGSAPSFEVQGNYLYFSDTTANVVHIYDIRDVSNPVEVGSFASTSPARVAVQGSLLVVAAGGVITTVDVSNPTAPASLGTYTYGTGFGRMLLRGRYLYTSAYSGGDYIQVIDIQRPSNPTLVQTLASFSTAYSRFDIAGNSIYLPNGATFSEYSFTQAEITGLKTRLADIGELSVRNNATIEGRATILGGLSVAGTSIFDGVSVAGTSTYQLLSAVNSASGSTDNAWGAYINSLLVGSSPTATGTRNYRMVVGYDPTQTRGLCIDDLSTAFTCPTTLDNTSIIAEHAITAGGFDLAERYLVTGDAIPGEVVSIDTSTSTRTTRSEGIPYDPKLMGVVSTAPGLVLGLSGGVTVALSGRVPTFVSTINGAIAIGDPLTSSIYPGVAMKATKPGKIIGHALEAADATSTIEVFIKVGYDASSLLANDGENATVQSDLVIAPTHVVSEASPLANSWGLTFRGRAWNGATAVNADYSLSTQLFSATSSRWSLRSGTSTVFAVDQSGNTSFAGDVALAGRLFPSARGVAQREKYIFLETGPASSTYITTNADGWQSNDSYDYAERYYSPDALTPGDVVVVSQKGRFHVQRSMNGTLMPMGIVSTKPGFVTGAPATSTYPIALAGRVPTHVSIINGPIAIGDLLAPSDIPGVAVKAIKAGPVIGQALEAYIDNQVGSIEVFVQVGWWGGLASVKEPEKTKNESAIPVVAGTKIYQGLARITTRGTKVRVEFPSVGTYPLVQVTPYGEIEGGWWTQNYTHTGFDILLKKAQMHELSFAWRVESMTPEQSTVPLSDGSLGQIDIDTGALIPKDPVDDVIEEISTPTPTPVPTPTPAPIVEPTITSTASVVPAEEPVVETVPINTTTAELNAEAIQIQASAEEIPVVTP